MSQAHHARRILGTASLRGSGCRRALAAPTCLEPPRYVFTSFFFFWIVPNAYIWEFVRIYLGFTIFCHMPTISSLFFLVAFFVFLSLLMPVHPPALYAKDPVPLLKESSTLWSLNPGDDEPERLGMQMRPPRYVFYRFFIVFFTKRLYISNDLYVTMTNGGYHQHQHQHQAATSHRPPITCT
jgi:hypothetical protein